MKYFILATILLASLAVANEAAEGLRAEVPNEFAVAQGGPVWDGPNALLFDDGPWWNSAGTGVGGADESILQSWGTTYGYGFQLAYDYRMADDFEVPSGEEWIIESVTFAGYQTGSGLTPTLNGMFMGVYDDNPNTGTLIAGDPYDNVFTSAEWSGIYRVNESGTGTNTDRPIMACTAVLSTPWDLTEGTYWLTIQADGTGSSGPWHPPVVIWDQQNTGNGMQSLDGGVSYTPIVNGTEGQGLTFVLEGYIMGALDQATWGSIKSIF
ncbi:MAG: hypothetical protein JXA64_00495 [Candidatus Fermentibacteraceae bacterium]|nr:hypothetical protein [Candidatus Fermentibacteraceae bacterium]MBN2607564.1 hypothetical protein [Candidatus Fermentibacteraceae bacterium]